jgi:hypothetical protein
MCPTRRALLIGLVVLAVPGANTLAQRPAQPIYRPGWSGRPLQPGRLNPYAAGGVGGAAPGTFTVVSVNRSQNTLKLRDGDGRTADVFVRSDLYDLSTLKSGDEVAVDFLVPDSGETRLAAGSIFKIEPDRP